MAFSDEFLSELRDRNDIEDVISTYVNLKRQGKILKGLCPFQRPSHRAGSGAAAFGEHKAVCCFQEGACYGLRENCKTHGAFPALARA